MRKFPIVLTMVLGSSLPAAAQCIGEPDCDVPPALRLSSAAVGDPPLVWSSEHGRLVPLPPGVGRAVGPVVMLGEIAGFKISSAGDLPRRLSYNDPETCRDADGGTVLLPLLRPRYSARVRGVYP